MIRNKNSTSRLVVFGVGLFFLVANLFSAQGGQYSVRTLPPGDWTFSAHPYFGPDFGNRPIVVSSVGSHVDPGKDVLVNQIRLENIASKAAVGVKLAWMLQVEEDRTKNLREGTTKMVTLKSPLQPNDTVVLDYPVTSVLRATKDVLTGTRLEGHYRIEIAVDEISFADGSTWSAKSAESDELPIVKAAYQPNYSPLVITPLVAVASQCPHQNCVFVPGPPDSYTCGGSGQNEICTNCVTHCCNTVCGFQPSCSVCGGGGT